MKLNRETTWLRELPSIGSQGPDRIKVAFALEPKFMKRVRPRLRTMHEQYGANFRFNANRCILSVSGTEESIDSVRAKLRSMIGARMPLPAPLWAELLRTRMLGSSDRYGVTIARVQSVTGCHLHVERGRHEVRLTGDDVAVSRGVAMLEELASECVAEVYGVIRLGESKLHALALETGVTFHLKEGDLVILGLRHSVSKAIHAVREAELVAMDDLPVSLVETENAPPVSAPDALWVSLCTEGSEESTGSSSTQQYQEVKAFQVASSCSDHTSVSAPPLVWSYVPHHEEQMVAYARFSV